MTREEILKKSNIITSKIMELDKYKSSTNIMTFLSFDSEYSTYGLIEKSIDLGKNISVPITDPRSKTISPSIIKSLDELELGHYNILTPSKEYIRPIDKNQIELIIVPAIVYDKFGYRIGYGGGYYDRFFSDLDKSILRLGVAFDFQVVEKLPTDAYDLPVGMIITDKTIHYI